MQHDTQFKISFFGVGPQKAATSWLDETLRAHPSLCLPQGVKETFYFDRRFEKKPADWYRRHFKASSANVIFGEIGPTYFDSKVARERIARSFPDALVIISIRNPVRRSFSLFRHHLSKGRVANDFWKACSEMPSILSSGKYSEHIPAWQQCFGRDNVLLIVDEDIRTDPAVVWATMCNFLRIESISMPDSAKGSVYSMRAPRFPILLGFANSVANGLRGLMLFNVVRFFKRIGAERLFGGGEGNLPSLSPSLYKEIWEKVESEVNYLETLLCRNFSDWRPSRVTQPDKPALRDYR